MSTKFLSPGWRMPRNANQSKSSNYSMYFNGSSKIRCGTANTYNEFTLSAWIKKDSTAPNYAGIFGTRNSTAVQFPYLLSLDNTGKVRLIAGGTTSVLSDSAINNDTWYHVVGLGDGTNLKLYINGQLQTATATYTTQSANNDLVIGGQFDTDSTSLWVGQIDGVAIFDYALSSSQITTLWGGGTSVSNPMALPSPPIAYYPLGTSAWNGEYLAENNAIGDYVFDFVPNDFIDCGAISVIPSATQLSVSFWANTNSTSQNQVVFGDNSSSPIFSFEYWGSNNRMYFEYGSNLYAYLPLTSVVTAGNWHNVAMVYDASGASNTDKIKIYVDGVDKSSSLTYNGTIPASLNASIGDFWIGNGQKYNVPFNGKISNVQIFNTALPATEVETLYNYGSPIRTLANIPQNSNLKAWYKLDASEVYNSTTTEWSIDNNQNPSAYPSSLDFDAASSDYIDCGNDSSLNLTSQITASVWAKFEGLNNNKNYGLISNFDPNTTRKFTFIYYPATASGSRLLRVRINSSNGTLSGYLQTSIDLSDDKWHHLAFTFDGTTNADGVNLYVDGIRISSFTANNPGLASSTGSILIGSYLTSDWYMNGSISNASIWNTALTSAQVTEIYNNGTPSNLSSHSASSNLVSWWKLNNTTTGIEDSKGSNNGTNNGATEYPGFVNVLAGDSSGMSQANLVQSDLQTVAPYSKYAMNFDGTDYINCGNDSSLNMADNGTDSFTFSFWIKRGSTNNEIIISKQVNGGSYNGFETSLISNKIRVFLGSFQSPTAYLQVISTNTITGSDWKNVVITYDGSQNVNGFNIYINKVPETLSALKTDIPSGVLNSANFQISGRSGLTLYDGSISNLSYWNTALTSAQVTEIYNQGLPSNLNSHSAYSNLVSWWQLGENSSFDGNDWIVADEKGSNNGTSTGMPVGALTNGVGTTANGVSSGMSEGNLVGDAPYSTANALSTNMVVTSRVTGSGNTP